MRAAAALLLAGAAAAAPQADKCYEAQVRLCRDAVSVSVASCRKCLVDNLSALKDAGCTVGCTGGCANQEFCNLAPESAPTPIPSFWPTFVEYRCTDNQCQNCSMQVCPLFQCIGPTDDGKYSMSYKCVAGTPGANGTMSAKMFKVAGCMSEPAQTDSALGACARSASGKYIKRTSCDGAFAAEPPVQLYNETPTPGCRAAGGG